MNTDMRRLPAVCEEQTRICIAEPAYLHGASTESTNVREESFDSSEAEQNAAETSPAHVLVANEVLKRIVWVESFQYSVVIPGTISCCAWWFEIVHLLGEIVDTKSSIEGEP